MRHTRIRGVLPTLIILTLASLACNLAGQVPRAEPTTDVMARYIYDLRLGSLRMADGCLRIGEGEDSHVIVWPPDFEVSRESDITWVYYDDYEFEFRLGQPVALAGGEITSIEVFDERTREQVPAGCEGPYLLVGSIGSAGSETGAGALAKLVGDEWRLSRLHGEELIKGTEISLRFEEDTLSGSMTCNGYGGESGGSGYSATEDGALTILEPLTVTENHCGKPKGIMEQEAAYVEALQSARAYAIVFRQLQVADASGEITLIFELAE